MSKTNDIRFKYGNDLNLDQVIQKTRERMGPRSMLVLLAAPKAVDYYPRIGFTKHNSAWVLKAADPFPNRTRFV
jgi:hypothetical protein